MLTVSVASLTSLAIFIIVVYSSFRNGLFSTLVTLFVIVLSGMSATAFFVPLSRMLLFVGRGWYNQPLCFMVVFVLGLVVLQTMANYLLPPRVQLPKAVDLGGGAALGLVNGYFMTGFLMTAFCLFPGTGEPSDKVIFLNRRFGADVFFVKAMKCVNRHAGSVGFPADEFLDKARKEKYRDSVKQRSDLDIETENSECFIRLDRLGNVLEEFIQTTGNYPKKLDDLYEYLPKRRDPKQREEMLRCPVTGFRYVLFPVDDYQLVKGDQRYVLIYDAAPGKYGPEYGHLGKGEGKRATLFADGHVRWVSHGDLNALLQAQRNVLKQKQKD
ncbi:MAG: hypothetical protein AMK75_06205 [Planctomycetes bacterium SM23_65]|nr:MAG: hypothetical protein AMK75_06205 [Planctomycetes bacterium SM23_65]